MERAVFRRHHNLTIFGRSLACSVVNQYTGLTSGGLPPDDAGDLLLLACGGSGCAGLGLLGAVLAPALVAVLDALGVERTTNDVVAHAWRMPDQLTGCISLSWGRKSAMAERIECEWSVTITPEGSQRGHPTCART